MPDRLSTANLPQKTTLIRRTSLRALQPRHALALLPLLAFGCASLQNLFGAGNAELSLVPRAARPERIASLEATIAADHDRLKALVTSRREDSDGPLHENEDLRTIAERLSRNEDELEALLQAERTNEAARGTGGARANR